MSYVQIDFTSKMDPPTLIYTYPHTLGSSYKTKVKIRGLMFWSSVSSLISFTDLPVYLK